MPTYSTPGVYKEDVFLAPAAALRTGVPAFLGYTQKGPSNAPQMLTLWPQFEQHFGEALPNGYLAYAVRGFFDNSGDLCYAVRLNDGVDTVTALRDGLDALAPLDSIDLVCAPDITRPRPPENLPPDRDEVRTMQAALLDHCEKLGDRFALLDALPAASVAEVVQQRRGLSATNGALYYPWVRVPAGPVLTNGVVPPCGHVAGVYARSDQRVGVHKAPANDVLQGVVDLEVNLINAQQDLLNPEGINCLRAFPGRGIRIWGARTLSRDPAWTYINVRRLFLTAGRWIERNMAAVAFEPNDPRLWTRIGRELTAYFTDLFRRGALKGRTSQEAFYVKCDGETNPPAVRDAGMVVTEIGLAPALPDEFVVVRVIHGANGVTIAEPTRPG
jgi:Bacteriophage tail sheath protein